MEEKEIRDIVDTNARNCIEYFASIFKGIHIEDEYKYLVYETIVHQTYANMMEVFLKSFKNTDDRCEYFYDTLGNLYKTLHEGRIFEENV